jgi:acetyl esterase/lipase
VAADITGVPQALIMAAEFDPLSVEDMAYAERLTNARIAVEAKYWEGQFHGSQQLWNAFKVITAAMSKDERTDLFSATAQRVYALYPRP